MIVGSFLIHFRLQRFEAGGRNPESSEGSLMRPAPELGRLKKLGAGISGVSQA